MRSRYFRIRKEGATGYVKKKMTSTVFDGNLRMIRAYNRHGREQDSVFQIACDPGVEEGFLAKVRKEGIERLPQDCVPICLTREHPERGTERETLEREHAQQVLRKWRRSDGASEMRATRDHFPKLKSQVKERLEEKRREEDRTNRVEGTNDIRRG